MNLLKDLFDRKILKYTLLPFILSIIFWGIVFFLFKNLIYTFINSYILYLPFGEKLQDILSAIGSGIVIFVLYYFCVISTLGVFTSFFIDKIVLRINKKHYHCEIKEAKLKDSIKGIWIGLKSFFIYFIIFVFTFFLLFIPIVNIFYEMFLFTVLNKKPLVFDSSYLFFNPEEIEKKYKIRIFLLVFLSNLIYFIPIVSLFGYTFQLIIMAHFVLKQCKVNK
jgi:uncharacterized protein involved in cysteine biosynthesis